MKYPVIVIILTLMGWIPNLSETQRKYDKKINRIIYRLWDLKNMVKEEITIPLKTYDDFSKENFNISCFKLKHNDILKGYLILSNAVGCRNGGCKAPGEAIHNVKEINDFLKYDNFSFALFFDLNYNLINVTILEYESEYGYEICSRNWLKQFVKFNTEPYNYGENIQAISGATVSATSLTNAISELKKMMLMLKAES